LFVGIESSGLYLLETILDAALEVAVRVCFSAASAASRTLSAASQEKWKKS
jgi:hypothetical protein